MRSCSERLSGSKGSTSRGQEGGELARKPRKKQQAKSGASPKRSKVAKSVRVCIRVWVMDDGRIRLFSDDREGKIKTTIAPGLESLRRHPHLYRQLRRLLSDGGRWPDDL